MQLLYKTTLLFFMLPIFIFGNTIDKPKHEKSKTIKKEFRVNKDATVSLKNKYGNINISTWNKNTVDISIKITVKGNDLDEVLDRLEDISIDFNNGASFVNVETIIESKKSSWNWWGNRKNLNFKIDYSVKMPVNNQANLRNKYGNIYLDKLNGRSDISCDYGKINIGQLNNFNNIIDLDYCSSSTISFARNADINIDYSKLTVEKAQTVKLDADYSTFYGDDFETFNFNTDYGSLRIGDVANVDGNGDYTSIKIASVSKNLLIDTDYGSITVEELKKGFEHFEVEASYAGVSVGTSDNNNFSFDIYLQYGGFRYDSDLVDIYQSDVKSTRKSYKGVFGKGKPKSTFKIRSKYGSVKIR